MALLKVLIPGACKCQLIWKKGLCRRGYVEDLEMGRSCWIMQVGPECNHKCLCKTEAEGDLIPRHRTMGCEDRERLEDTFLGGHSVGSTSWGTLQPAEAEEARKQILS